MNNSTLRVLAITTGFYPDHLDYLAVLGQHCDLAIATNGERKPKTVSQAIEEGFSVTRIGSIGFQRMEARLRKLVDNWRPDVVYTLWDSHEEITLMVRRVVGQNAIVIHHCSDPATTLFRMQNVQPGHKLASLEKEALEASNGQIFVTNTMRTYLEQTHDLDLSKTSIIVPHARSEHTVCPPSRKLSTDDGRIHIALVGVVVSDSNHSRYYINIIRRLVSYGFVVHSHFHEGKHLSNQPYRDLAEELIDYHYHPTIPNRVGTELSQTISLYDLMGVFHELEATKGNESTVLETCMPSKAVCGWVNGGIPVVCFAQYRGVAEFIQEFGMGFLVQRWEDLEAIAADKGAIDRATEACLRERYRFTHEWHAPRVIAFFEQLISQSHLVAVS